MSGRLEEIDFARLSGWEADDHAAALAAFRLSAARALERPYRSRALTTDKGFAAVARLSLETGAADDPRAFFEHRFRPHRVHGGPDVLTGYFEPLVEASPVRTATHTEPLLRRPPDLVDARDVAPELRDTDARYGRVVDGRLKPYHDRAAIRAGALAGRGLEIVWLDPVDAFTIHVQGSARLRVGPSLLRVGYAAKSGHSYTSLGRVMRERLGVTPDEMTMDRLTAWMRTHRGELDDLLALNRSYIFFAVTDGNGHGTGDGNGGGDEEPVASGPAAAAAVPLTPGRSLAVDRALHTFGWPHFVSTAEPLPGDAAPMRRLLVAQDTGSAIVGPARGDLFVGTGDEAGVVAGRINHRAAFVVLLPR